MNILTRLSKTRFCCITIVGMLGILPFFGSPEEPNAALQRFVKLFVGQDAAGITKIVQPEIASEIDVTPQDVESFLKRYRSNSLTLENSSIDKIFESEDKKTERFQATLSFRGPSLSPEYPKPSTLKMILLWVMQDGKWWLERPLSITQWVTSSDAYPTEAQNEAAARFKAAVAVLDQLGLPGKEDLAWVDYPSAGNAIPQYKELEKLHLQERGSKGIDARASGVQVLLKAAGRSQSGLLQIYQGDFPSGPDDKRRPVPWDMFRDYVQAAIKLGKLYEKQAKPKEAERIYRRVISLGRQFLDEPGGFQYMNWGMTFQKQGAEALAGLLRSNRSAEKQQVAAFANLTSRRLDLLQTALNTLDDMADYKSLKAAILASGRAGDSILRPWGINTLAILALRGAPADPSAMKAAGGVVLVKNPVMEKKALAALNELSSEPSGKVKSFIEDQKQWIRKHRVYGAAQSFR
jgi:tetratricopeptide (TPR) repeat protein